MLLLAAVLVGAVLVWGIVPTLRGGGSRATGDGRRVETYGFDLSTCLVPRQVVAASGFSKDGLPALVAPRAVPAAEAAVLKRGRGPYLVSEDRVVGLSIGGESRAYPLSILNWHEIVNDSLGGVPIAVTYNPLTAGVAVFDRRAGRGVLEFGVSGLLFQSNLLLFDRAPDGLGESLWSQLEARAVAGPAALVGRQLDVLPCSVARWADWRHAFPRTTVLVPPNLEDPKYRRDPYATYFSGSRLVAPVDPYPPPPPLAPKSRVLVVEGPGWRRTIPLDGPNDAAPELDWPEGTPAPSIDRSTDPASVVVPAGAPYRTFYALWFAWYATHAGSGRRPDV